MYLFQLMGLSVLSTGVQLLAGSQVLSTATGISFELVTVLLAVIALSYSLFSGIKASMLTDAIQMIFMLAASAAFLIMTISPAELLEYWKEYMEYPGITRSFWYERGIEVFLAFGLPTTIGLLSGPFGDQSFWQRAFAVKGNRIGHAFLVGAILFGMVPFSMGILGFAGAGIGYQAKDLGVINFD